MFQIQSVSEFVKKKKSKVKDPYHEREAQKYLSPIVSREFILDYMGQYGKPVTFAHLAENFELQSSDKLSALDKRLRAMERDGQLFLNRKGMYCLINKADLIKGTVIGHPDGYGFVTPEEGDGDLYLSSKEMRGVFHGDVVLVRNQDNNRRGRTEASVVEVLQRNTHQLVGRYYKEKGVSFVIPDNRKVAKDILIPKESSSNAINGHMVMVKIVAQPSPRSQPVGEIIEVLGEHMAPGMEVDVAIRSHELPYLWPEEVLIQSEALPTEVLATELTGRVDIRELPLVTIDGEDARDFDDAVYCEKRPKGGWRLLVAIADVSHYVLPDTPLDQEALLRGNSVYFPNRVIPMLPEALSNDLCSLKPNCDRLCMVCEMTITSDGKLSRYRFYEGVMHSQARLTYNKVAAMLEDSDPVLIEQYSAVYPHLVELYELYKILNHSRQLRGAIDLEIPETKIIFGEGHKIKKIVPTRRNDAHRLIEECMLMANIASAKLLEKHKIPGLFRVHARPNSVRLEELREFLKEFNLGLLGGSEPSPKDFASLLVETKKRDNAEMLQMVILRSLSQAIYDPENVGHFGLAFEAYAHFTSPIRRYPDLLLHRAIRHVCRNHAVSEFRYTRQDMERLGLHTSKTERRADEATRDVVDWLKCEYMQDHLGTEFLGVIVTVKHFGLFVQLKDVYIEGLIHVSSLKNDYYHFDPVRHQLIGEKSKKNYRIGDDITIKVSRVDLDSRQIDFVLV